MRAWTHEAIAALHADAPPLGDLLPWRWVEADGVHVLADGSLGLAWRLPLVDAELLTAEQREPTARAFDGLLARLPAGTAFQVVLSSQPGRSPRLAEWAAAPADRTPLLVAMTHARVATLSASTPTTAPVRDLTLILTLRYWPAVARARTGWRRLARWARGRSAEREAADAWREADGALETCRVLVESQCRVAGLVPERLDGPGLLAVVWPLLNPGCPDPPPRYRDDWALHRQATQTDHGFRPDGWTTSGLSPTLEGRMLSLLTLPAETWPGLVTLPRAVGGSGGMLDLPGTCWFTVAGHVLDQERAVAWLKLKRTLAFQQRLTLLGDQRLTLLGDTAVETTRMWVVGVGSRHKAPSRPFPPFPPGGPRQTRGGFWRQRASNTALRNARVRSLSGLLNSFSGLPCSAIRPS
jgi:hypothetical protein